MAGLFGHLAHTRVAGSGVPSYGLIPPLGSVASASGLLVSQATAMGVSAVFGCVRRRSIDAARCPPSLYWLEEDGRTRTPFDGDHPLQDLFAQPNSEQNWFEFAEMLNVALLLRQNAYAVILRDQRGNPVELIPVNPDAVMVLEGGDGKVFYNVNRIGLWQIAKLRDLPVAIPAEDMLHLRGLTFNALVGVSTIGLARDAIGLAMGFEQQAARWMANGARPAGILQSTKMLSEDAGKRLKAQWQELFGGVQNTGSTAVLEDGVEWKQLQLTGEDLQFLPQRQNQVLEVCRFFGVPPHKVYVTDRAASMNIPQQDQDYVNSTVAPDLERWEHKLRQTFVLWRERRPGVRGGRGLFVDFNEEQLLRADILTRRNAARLGILSGLTTPDEERRAEGLPPKGADELLVPANTAALGSDMTGTAPDSAGRPSGGNGPAPSVPTSGDQPSGRPVADDDVIAGDEAGRAAVRLMTRRDMQKIRIADALVTALDRHRNSPTPLLAAIDDVLREAA